MLKVNLLVLGFAVLVLHQAQGQHTPPTTRPLTKKEQREAKRLEEAKKKPDYDPAILGHAYFGSENWAPGTVWYNGATFRNTPLRYDLVRDEITLPPDEPDAPAHKYKLLSEKVDSFAIHGHRFVRMEAEGMPEGFYDKLYDGKIKVFARRQKYIYKETTYQAVNHRFLTEDRYYLYRNGQYHLIKNRAALQKVLRNRKKDVEQFIQKEQLSFKDDFEQDLLKVAAYYDKLR